MYMHAQNGSTKFIEANVFAHTSNINVCQQMCNCSLRELMVVHVFTPVHTTINRGTIFKVPHNVWKIYGGMCQNISMESKLKGKKKNIYIGWK